MKTSPAIGSTVQYNGEPAVVLGEWGSWLVCRNCFSPDMQRADYICKTCRAAVGLTFDLKKDRMVPLHFEVSGSGIYDIKFADGRKSAINKEWLKR